MSHLDKAQAYFYARRLMDEKKEVYTRAYEECKRAEKELIESMIEDGVKSFKLDGVAPVELGVSLRKNFAVSCTQDNEQQVRSWLETEDGDITKFEKLVLFKPFVVAWLKERVEKGTIDQHAIPDFLNFSMTPTVMVKGWKGATEE
jgi:uncharacterized protein YggL (DUF469 family)